MSCMFMCILFTFTIGCDSLLFLLFIPADSRGQSMLSLSTGQLYVFVITYYCNGM